MITRLSDYVANFIREKNVRDIFMLTGYGAMYLNDSIKKTGINIVATRNEATAPMMASSYSKISGNIGCVCVTAGPGATNAIPGLAEAYVDSSAVLIISGQVEKNHTTYCANIPGLRTLGTAEINIIPIVKPITKYAEFVENPEDIRFILEKAYYLATQGRPGPVWIDIPLDVQSCEIDTEKLRPFIPEAKETNLSIKEVIETLSNAKRPLIVAGQGIRQGKAIEEFVSFIESQNLPVVFSRMGQDIISHDHPNVFGQAGIKGVKYGPDIMKAADVVLSLGSRLAVQFVGHNFEAFSKDAKIMVVDIDQSELKKPGNKITLPIQMDVKLFFEKFNQEISFIPNRDEWLKTCRNMQVEKPMSEADDESNPINLYHFMSLVGKCTFENHILVTDAGSNYYVGGQVWKFQNKQREITSGCNAAMGTTVPLAIGAALAAPEKQIIAITGDGSVELNIQELKTISHYGHNIKLFVINNGGYVSMKKWQDSYFEGRRIDTEEDTGVGTLNFVDIAKAFDLKYSAITKASEIESELKEIFSHKSPMLIEVFTDNFQKIVHAFVDK